jgi:cell division protein FtsB
LAANLTACVADSEEFDAAERQRDEYRAQLRELYQTNDALNREITGLYAECAALSSQLALVAAAKVQLEYTTDLLAAPARQRPRGTGGTNR